MEAIWSITCCTFTCPNITLTITGDDDETGDDDDGDDDDPDGSPITADADDFTEEEEEGAGDGDDWDSVMVSLNPLQYQVDDYDDEDFDHPPTFSTANHTYLPPPPPITAIDIKDLLQQNYIVVYALGGVFGCVIIGGVVKLSLHCYRKRHGTAGTLPVININPQPGPSSLSNASSEELFNMEEEMRQRKNAKSKKDNKDK